MNRNNLRTCIFSLIVSMFSNLKAALKKKAELGGKPTITGLTTYSIRRYAYYKNTPMKSNLWN